MAKSDYEIFKEIHQLYARNVIVINQAVRLIDSEAAHIQAFAKLLLPEVKENALASLETDGREVSPVRSSFNIRKSHSKEILITPEKNLSSV